MVNNLLRTEQSSLPFAYAIKRSRRKTLCIQIKQSQVRVLAPQTCPKEQIIGFINTKKEWIINHLKAQHIIELRRQEIQENPQILCRGVLKTVVITKAICFALREEQHSILIDVPHKINPDNIDAYVKKKLAMWFHHQAKEHFAQRLAKLSQQLNLEHTDLIIKQYKARWGSCNSKGVISLNYLLMMTPATVIDYVMIHELCHLKHMNHSANFWDLVQKHDPQYKQAKLWLKEHSQQLRAFH